MRSGLTICATAISMAVAVPASANDDNDYKTPVLVQTLYSCQGMTDQAARLACFDKAAADIRAAEEKRDLSFADREQVRKARRGLFGLGNIRLGIFSRGKGDPEDEPLDEIEANIASITTQRDGKLLLRLEDGALWSQTSYEKIRIREMKAKKVKIKRGTLGNYNAQLDGGSYIKVKRVN